MKEPSIIPVYLFGAVKIALAVACALWTSGCTIATPQKFYSNSNFDSAVYQGRGFKVTIIRHNPALTVQKYGAAGTQVTSALGAAVATSGVIR